MCVPCILCFSARPGYFLFVYFGCVSVVFFFVPCKPVVASAPGGEAAGGGWVCLFVCVFGLFAVSAFFVPGKKKQKLTSVFRVYTGGGPCIRKTSGHSPRQVLTGQGRGAGARGGEGKGRERSVGKTNNQLQKNSSVAQDKLSSGGFGIDYLRLLGQFWLAGCVGRGKGERWGRWSGEGVRGRVRVLGGLFFWLAPIQKTKFHDFPALSRIFYYGFPAQ